MPVAFRKRIFRRQLVACSEVRGSPEVTKSFHPHQKVLSLFSDEKSLFKASVSGVFFICMNPYLLN
jgi:hypothetical protein